MDSRYQNSEREERDQRWSPSTPAGRERYREGRTEQQATYRTHGGYEYRGPQNTAQSGPGGQYAPQRNSQPGSPIDVALNHLINEVNSAQNQLEDLQQQQLDRLTHVIQLVPLELLRGIEQGVTGIQTESLFDSDQVRQQKEEILASLNVALQRQTQIGGAIQDLMRHIIRHILESEEELEASARRPSS